MSRDLFADYPAAPADEAVDPDGRLRDGYAVLATGLRALGIAGLTAAATAMAVERDARGVTVASWADGRQTVRPYPLDPVPAGRPRRRLDARSRPASSSGTAR